MRRNDPRVREKSSEYKNVVTRVLCTGTAQFVSSVNKFAALNVCFRQTGSGTDFAEFRRSFFHVFCSHFLNVFYNFTSPCLDITGRICLEPANRHRQKWNSNKIRCDQAVVWASNLRTLAVTETSTQMKVWDVVYNMFKIKKTDKTKQEQQQREIKELTWLDKL